MEITEQALPDSKTYKIVKVSFDQIDRDNWVCLSRGSQILTFPSDEVFFDEGKGYYWAYTATREKKGMSKKSFEVVYKWKQEE